MKTPKLAASDIKAYLKQHEQKDLLRFLTCGSVDDGKSTLIGRMLYDSHLIYEDQLAALTKDSKIYGTTSDDFDPALLMDGLKAEREQGITIDVAYRYFSTDKRKFIIADCPGHEQYTRNMATGASNCNLAVILIDARNGVITQTKRHSFICSLFGIQHVIVAINKMDLVDWSQEVYDQICHDYNSFCARMGFVDIHFIPISALKGDNVIERSEKMPWYDGPTLLHHLESVNIAGDRNLIDMRFPVQYVVRPNHEFRGFAGSVASGVIRKGDKVMVLPSRRTSEVKSIVTFDGELDEAFVPMPATVTLTDEIDISRGDMIVPVKNVPHLGNAFEAMLIWVNEKAGHEGKSYLVKIGSTTVPGVLSSIRYKVNVNTMRKENAQNNDENAEPTSHPPTLELNEIGRVHMTLHRDIAFDAYDHNRRTGAFVIIDRVTNLTVGAGMIVERATTDEVRPLGLPRQSPKSKHITRSESMVSIDQRRALFRQNGAVIWLTGLSGSGKSTIAKLIEKRLFEEGHPAYILDGDNIRHGLNRDLGFSAEDRSENIRRVAEVAHLFVDAGFIVITSFISPYRKDRNLARDVIESRTPDAPGAGEDTHAQSRFFEIHLDAPLDVCEARDPKGLYKKARAGEIRQFTGVTAPYEPPESPEIRLNTADKPEDECIDLIINKLKEAGVIGDV